MKNVFLLHTREGVKLFSREDLINNAKQQKAHGARPLYRRLGKEGPEGPAGYLVFSTYDDGAGVAVIDGGKEYIMTGWQGDFCC